MTRSGVLFSSPSPVLYTIAPVPGPVQPGGPKVIVLPQISTAHYLERSQIVRSSENYRLDVMSNDWWGEPLSAMLSRVLTEELGQRLPQSTVIGETGAVSASPDATIELNVKRLDEDAIGARCMARPYIAAQLGAHQLLRRFPDVADIFGKTCRNKPPRDSCHSPGPQIGRSSILTLHVTPCLTVARLEESGYTSAKSRSLIQPRNQGGC